MTDSDSSNRQPMVREPPKSLKHIGDWIRLGGYVVPWLTPLVSMFFGETGGAIAVALTVLLIVGYIAVPYWNRAKGWRLFADVEEGLAGSASLSPDLRKRASEAFRWLRRLLIAAVLGLGLLATVATWFIVVPVASRFVRTKLPTEIPLRRASFFSPVDDEQYLKDHPWLNAVWGQLKDEAVGQRFRIAVLETKPLPHPTPDFTMIINYEGSAYDFSGYAFLIHRDSGGQNFRSLQIDYRKDGLFVAIPECAENDFILVFGRFTVRGRDFPTELSQVFKVHTTKSTP